MPEKLTSKQQVQEFLDQYDNFLFDCDGVLWLGEHLLPQIVETLDMLRKLGKKLIFVTNNSMKSREQYVKKFEKFGIKGVTKNDVFGSSYAAAVYLTQILKFDTSKKAWVIGGQGIHDELKEFGIESIGGTDPALNVQFSEDSPFLKLDPSVGAVVAGLDQTFNYHKLAVSLQYLQQKDTIFIATNTDSTFPSHGRILPGAGSVVEALRVSSGKEPIICGKPHQNLLKSILAEHPIDLKRSVMVGDRLNTDMKFGLEGGMGTLLVLTGIEKEDNVVKQVEAPKYFANKLGDLYELTK